MPRPTNHTLDYLTTEPVRVAAVLRLPLIVLIALLVYIQDVEHWLPGVYGAVLLLYAAFAVVWLVIVVRNPVRWWFGVASTGLLGVLFLFIMLRRRIRKLWKKVFRQHRKGDEE